MRNLTRSIYFIYLGLSALGLFLAILRLSESALLPGLAAIEIVLLSMPWSLALGVDPFARAGWLGMVMIVVGGLGLNAFLLRSWIQCLDARCISSASSGK